MDNNFYTLFRPQRFEDVVGQETAKTVLKKIASTDGIACRAIVLQGAYGSGKSTLCRIFGAAMNDKDFKRVGDVTPENCVDVYCKNSQLYWEFDSSVAGNIDAIRGLTDRLSYVPNGRRVVVFDECHSCSKAALNALLKLVEEGIPNTIFVFATTEPLLPTLMSRAICLEVTTVPPVLMKQRLTQVANQLRIGLPEHIQDAICSKSKGHMRDALGLLQLYTISGAEALNTSYSTMVRFFIACASHNREGAESSLRALMLYPMTDIKSSLTTFLRDLFNARPEDKLYAFKKINLHQSLFNFFYTPVNQMALKEEAGMELVFLSLIDKICK